MDSSENFRKSIRPIIEINHGLFRRRSAIYGPAAKNWEIAKAWRWISGDGRDCVSLTDTQGLRAEIALQMINNYPSLQAMLDRIAELEKQNAQAKEQNDVCNGRIVELEQQLVVSNNHRQDWLAAVGALHLEITTDRQRYRSPAASHIRGCVEAIIDWAEQERKRAEQDGKPVFWIDPDKIMAWKKLFPVRCNGENFQKK